MIWDTSLVWTDAAQLRKGSREELRQATRRAHVSARH